MVQRTKQHRPGYDLTFNAPKSVSVLWARSDQHTKQKIQEAQLRAVREALMILEDNATFSRRGRGGECFEAASGIVAGLFEHSTNRAQDPHLHTHMTVANIACRADGTWGAIESRNLMLWQKAASSVYRASLSESIRQLGYKVEQDREAFRVVGIPDSICKHFSKRSEEIKSQIKKRGIKNRSKSADLIALSTREKKGEIDRPNLFLRWGREMDERGFAIEKLDEIKLKEQAKDSIDLSTPALDEYSVRTILTMNQSVFRAQDAYELAAKLAIENKQSVRTANIIASKVLESDNSIFLCRDWKHNALYTTKEVIEDELSLNKLAIELAKKEAFSIPEKQIDDAIKSVAFQLSDEQVEAVYSSCSASQISILQGSAGAGKSASMSCVASAYKSTGSKVLGTTIARAAANSLQTEAGIESHTIARLLIAIDSKIKPLQRGDVLIVDEAGQVGTQHINQLLKHAKDIGFKIILVGEDKQLDAIEFGGVLRYLSRAEVLGATRIETIRRQSQEWDRQAVAYFRDGHAAKALAEYDQRGQLHFADNDEEAKNKLVRAWNEYRHNNYAKNSIVIAQSWNDVLQLNKRMRNQLQQEGKVGAENISVKGIVNDRNINFEVSLGERIRLAKNDYRRAFTNGDTGTVIEIQSLENDDFRLKIQLDSGRQIQFNLSDYSDGNGRAYLTQAYAQTVYSAQGLTIDGDVFVYYTSFMDRAHTYVACSRHKDKAHIFVSKEDLAEHLPDSNKEPTEFELREALTKQMSRDDRQKLAIEYLSQEQINEFIKQKEVVLENSALEI